MPIVIYTGTHVAQFLCDLSSQISVAVYEAVYWIDGESATASQFKKMYAHDRTLAILSNRKA
jgi:hypothetical protein